MVVIIFGACMILGIDVKVIQSFISNSNFDLVIISLFIYEIIMGLFNINKLDAILENKDKIDNALEIISKNSENTDYIKSNLDEINTALKKHDKRFIEATSIITNKPNLTMSRTVINSYIKNMFNDIFEECLNYTLLVNEGNNEIAIQNMRNNMHSIIKEQIVNVHEITKTFDTDEKISESIKEKIYNMIDVISNDIQKNKKINEKLYIINCILRETRKDIKKDILDYFREMQTKIFD